MFHVKHQQASSDTDYLRECISAIGLQLEPSQESDLLSHLGAVLKHNSRTNLTAITEPRDAIRLHIVDSLCLVPYIKNYQNRLMDIGSGAGYPGMAIAIACPWLDVTMLESNNKKHSFLTQEIQRLGLSRAVALNLRAEEACDIAGGMEIVTARAVAALVALVELSAPLLVEGGELYAMKGRTQSAEIDEAMRAAPQCGMSFQSRHAYTLPLGSECREIWIFKKVGPPSIPLPRRSGRAQTRPLGR